MAGTSLPTPLNALFEAAFNAPLALYQQADVVFAPLLAPGWLLALAVLMAVAVLATMGWRLRRGGSVRRGLVLGLLQISSLALIVVLLAQPMLEYSRLTRGANAIAVLVDHSESMGFPDTANAAAVAPPVAGPGAAGGTRLDVAQALLQKLRPQLESLGEVSSFAFAETAVAHDLGGLSPDGAGTRLVAAIDAVLTDFGGQPLAAIVVLSDGADTHAGGLDLSRLAAAGVPVHTVGIGPARLPGEVQIVGVTMTPDAAPNSRVVADVTLRHHGSGAARLRVLEGDRVVAARTVTLDPGSAEVRESFAFDSGPGGVRDLTFEVDPPAGDVLAGNNRMHQLLTVNDRRRRVLYLEGEPRWEYKFLRRAVDGDPVLELTSWLRTTHRKTLRQNVANADQLDQGFPSSRAELYGYDVVVLGSLEAASLDADQHAWLESFVSERGGGLLAIAGRAALADGGWESRPLATALPVTLKAAAAATYQSGGGQVRPTAVGRRSPIVEFSGAEGADPWGSLPALGDYQQLGEVKPAASVLLEMVRGASPEPLLVLQPYGLGNAAVLATATTWRWRMGTPPDDVRHTLFWRQMLRQLAESARPRRDLSVTANDGLLRVRYADRDELYRPRAKLPAVALVHTGVAGEPPQPLTLTPGPAAGVVEGSLAISAPGVYRIDVQPDGSSERLTRFVRVGRDSAEQAEPAQNEALLRRIATATQGRYWRPDDVPALAGTLALTPAGVSHRERIALWNMPLLLAVLLLLKLGEWFLRRRWGAV